MTREGYFSGHGKFPGYRRPGIICVEVYVDIKDMEISSTWNFQDMELFKDMEIFKDMLIILGIEVKHHKLY